MALAGYAGMIERGIKEIDWKLVQKGLYGLTGTLVELPRQTLLEETEDNGVTSTGKNKKTIKKQVRASGKNLFVDTGSHEGELGLKTPPKKGKKLKRQSGVTNAKCKDCGMKQRIDKNLIQDGIYVCNDCILNKGGRR